MEAPTSSYTGSNLYNREHLFSLAPPCHPGFSGCNQMEATTSCVQEPTWNSEDYGPSEHLPTSLQYQIMNTQTTYVDKSLLTFLYLFCNSSLSLSTQQVSSASHFSIILLFFCFLYRSALLLLYHSAILLFLHKSASASRSFVILFFFSSACHWISCSASSPFSSLTISFFFHTEQPTQFSLAHFLLYTLPWWFHFPFQ